LPRCMWTDGTWQHSTKRAAELRQRADGPPHRSCACERAARPREHAPPLACADSHCPPAAAACPRPHQPTEQSRGRESRGSLTLKPGWVLGSHECLRRRRRCRVDLQRPASYGLQLVDPSFPPHALPFHPVCVSSRGAY